MDLSAALAKIEALEAEVASLKKERQAKINPVYQELIDLLREKPRTIGELADAMVRENRMISQWIHQLKTKYHVEIITLSDGRKQLSDPASQNLTFFSSTSDT